MSILATLGLPLATLGPLGPPFCKIIEIGAVPGGKGWYFGGPLGVFSDVFFERFFGKVFVRLLGDFWVPKVHQRVPKWSQN